ncbi:efflux RND transporter periplasmic adaptor subunit [bacterium]|nr:efflux RND transporter periplasmic adaptor subunit [bacterium]
MIPIRPLALALSLLFTTAACEYRNGPLIVSGRVEVDDIHVGSKLGGRVKEVCFEESQSVAAGSAVVLLDDEELLAQLAAARAELAAASAQLDLLLAGTRFEDILRAEGVVEAARAELLLRQKGFRVEEVAEAEAQVAQASSELAQARREWERALGLARDDALARNELDKKRTLFETARAKLDMARQREALVKSGSRPEEIAMAEARLKQAEAELLRLRRGPRDEEIAAARAARAAAAAHLERLQVQLAETRILAPLPAVVEVLDLEPGDLVRAGQTVAVLNLLNNPWVRCYVPENRLGWVKPGDEVRITVDSFPGRVFSGKVRRLAAEAEFTPRNVQTSEKRAELVFEMKVDVLDADGDLRAGMYADVTIPPPTSRP